MPKDKVRVIIATDDDVQYNGHIAQDVRNKAAGVAEISGLYCTGCRW